MDPRLVEFYDQELKYLRETAREFGAAYPTLAGRLGVNAPGEADPYVERLLEGVAFLAARVQLKLHDEFPKFTQHLLEAVYPHYLAPSPSVAVLCFDPKGDDPALDDGLVINRGSTWRIPAPEKGRSDAIFTTAHDVRLWPIRIAKIEYLSTRAAVAAAAGDSGLSGDGGVVISIEATGQAPLSALTADELTFYVGGAETLAGRIYEQLAGHTTGVALAVPGRRGVLRVGGPEALETPAFGADAGLLPLDGRSFRGYRILQEYFACPERFHFLRVNGLRRLLAGVEGRRMDIVIATSTSDKRLAGALNSESFRLFCAPVVNLFEKRCDPVLLDSGEHEYRVVPERMRPLDYEVYRLLDVVADATSTRKRRVYQPIYRGEAQLRAGDELAFYTMRRTPTRLSTLYPTARSSDYVGTECWIALSHPPSARGEPDQLSVTALCTNRDIADTLRGSGTQIEFDRGDASYLTSIRAVLRPTRPRLPVGFEDARLLEGGRSTGDRLWRLISHLRPNFESLFADEAAAARMREHLTLYARLDSATDKQQIEGLTGMRQEPAFRRVSSTDPLAFARGHRVSMTFDERSFPDGGAFLFSQVIDRFLSEFVSLNSFIESQIVSTQRGPIAHWGPRRGDRPTI